MGSGFDGRVLSLHVHNDTLYAGGIFKRSGPRLLNYVARWDGFNWLPVDRGFDAAVGSMTTYHGGLVALGDFQHAGVTPIDRIARLDGHKWQSFAEGLPIFNVRKVVVYRDTLVVSADFTTQDSDSVFTSAGMGKWTGTEWVPLTDGTCATDIFDLLAIGDDLYSCGTFAIRDFSTCAPGNRIARWDGVRWHALGSGLDDTALGLGFFQNSLYVGGRFKTAGGKPSLGVARWDDVITPIFVSEFSALAQNGIVHLKWRLQSELLSGIRFLRLQRALQTGGTFHDLAHINQLSTQMSFDDFTTEAGKYYSYRLLFETERGAEPSRTVEVITPVLNAGSSLLGIERNKKSIAVHFRMTPNDPVKSLAIFDVRGHLTKNLLGGALISGEHVRFWDYESQARGVYFVRLRSARQTEARKIIIRE